ncbi:glutathionylspermidine synthase family protein [Vibrio sp. D431a]|uniref:glutathionylspermidine synthase family protein n=1 Tax=Vibrio sp. D431a TaxID=2837388 RepID=UPI002557A9D5|nr:glutathionylspermidine synthase family protein [Vibrio sp. D431a]MDK9789802.1 glutathionylspermidine synthase family protein [Vibrio sp. D431a]
MRKQLHHVTPDFDELESECPKTSTIHMMMGEQSNLTSLTEEFPFPENEAGKTPFYEFSKEEVSHLKHVSEMVYKAMLGSLSILFSDDNREHIRTFFSSEFVDSYPEFIDYAIYTFKQKHKAISGRFDFAYDADSEMVTGVYEANMDSPVTYYDSVVLQHHLCKKLGLPNNQHNEHHETLVKAIPSVVNGVDKRIAVLCDVNFTEDSISAETVFHAFNEEATHIALFDSLSALDYDFGDLQNPLFTINDTIVDAIYSLYPWEYMVEDFYSQSSNPIKEWKLWVDRVTFLEPAWRYFLSNKGIFAWLTYLSEIKQNENAEVAMFIEEHRDAFKYILPSYVTKPSDSENWIQKPLIGRQSANISQVKCGVITELSSGDFVNSGWLYQKFTPPCSVNNNTKAIVCTWMAPTNIKGNLDMTCEGISVREFEGTIPTHENERFVPHLIKS